VLFPLDKRGGVFLLVVLGLFLLWRGIIPAWSRLDTDFPNYYAAGRIVLEHGDVNRLYDDTWFQSRQAAYGMDFAGKFAPFPPPTALPFVPLAVFEPLTALRIVTVLNLILLAVAMLALARGTGGAPWEAALLVLLSGSGLANCFRFGQLYIALSLTVILGYILHVKKRNVLAGIMFGVMIPIKYFPAIFLLYFVWKKEWRLVVSALVTVAVIGVISILVLGWDIHRQFFMSVVGGHLEGALTMQDPFSSTFQSFDALLRRLFVADTAWGNIPVIDFPAGYPILKAAIAAVILLVTLQVLPKANTGEALAVIALATMILLPASATYHMLILWLPVGLLLSGRASGRRSAAMFWSVLAIWSVIGFLPYSFFSRFDAHGWLSILAYPRLWLLVTLFVLSVHAIRSGTGVRARAGESAKEMS
jgi:hypothetical protein